MFALALCGSMEAAVGCEHCRAGLGYRPAAESLFESGAPGLADASHSFCHCLCQCALELVAAERLQFADTPALFSASRAAVPQLRYSPPNPPPRA